MGRGDEQRDVVPRRAQPLLPGLDHGKVLCWVNSVAEVDNAVAVGMSLAESAAGRCEVVLCLDAPCRSGPTWELGIGRDLPLTPEVIGRAERRLAALYAGELPTLVLPGDPITEIKRYAHHHDIDLIVMGEQCLKLVRQCGQDVWDDPPCAVMAVVLPPGGRATRVPAGRAPVRA